jgi:hypothetical protein
VTVLADVANIARNYLRDFPKFFQVSFDAVGRTYELGNPNVDTSMLWVATVTGNVVTELTPSQYALDSRNGILRLSSTPSPTTKLMVEGYYYEWVLPADLEFYAQRSINYHSHTVHIPLESASAAVLDVIGLGALVEALQALMTEYARDIDVSTSEAVYIPCSQRFRMLSSLVGMWELEYRKHANNLNIGPEKIEIMNLRRVSRTTNRYVPLYTSKEIGDYSPVERIFAEESPGQITLEEEHDELREDVYIDMDPPTGIATNAFY